MKLQWDLFVAFLRVGLLGYGGGPASIPLVYKEAVDRYKWMEAEEFGDIIALGNALPGPIITKLAGYVGYRVGGILGMINSLIASVLPTVILMIVLLKSLSSIKQFDWVGGMVAAVIPVVGVMLAQMTWTFLSNASKGLGWLVTIFMLGIIFFILHIFSVHPAIVIVTLLIMALVQKDKQSVQKKNEGKVS
ncbi:chromate transporter [Pallidibacillus pasinlerensis]|uniref:Chromate transporter n=1 Tax=Pallidibacillus pasinlerensis TaxID=2703818 RepID=A0ABX0A518_9BACI|nr:chromate transporter [Pallidibacillus pasinlerensis]NCU16297.1 chromate transporter [Pallidibacillus pasinlerensis]